MDKMRESSYNEFIKWYLEREKREKPEDNFSRIPWSARNRRKLMKKSHAGKLESWFERGYWSIISITQDEFERSMVLEGEWTEVDGLVDPSSDELEYRLLRSVAHTAIRIGYLETKANERMRDYYRKLKSGDISMSQEYIVLRSLGPNEATNRNPDALFYLHDGLGRSLPYQVLITEGYLSYEPVTAFLACHRG